MLMTGMVLLRDFAETEESHIFTRKQNKEAGLAKIHSLPLRQLDLDLFVDVEHRCKTWDQRVTGALPLSNPKGGNVNL